MPEKIYEIPVTFKFSGVFKVRACSPAEAEEHAERHCGLVLGGGIHSTLPGEDVDWDFPCHPEKIVGAASHT